MSGSERKRKIAVIANPVAGSILRRRPPSDLDAYIRSLAARHDVETHVALTEGSGHARNLAREALAGGASVVVAWGGDGTVNEVASVLVDGGGVLGIVPVGSGNGLARDLGVPRRPADALAAAIDGPEQVVDAGELNGRFFLSVAGIGFDAHVARIFAGAAGRTRGLASYVALTLREIFRYRSSSYAVALDGAPPFARRALLLSVANTRQWGNGARIAPAARIDDGRLDVVIVDARHPLLVISNFWRLFTGSMHAMKGVTVHRVAAARIDADPPAPVHVDGEPIGTAGTVTVALWPGTLRVRARP